MSKSKEIEKRYSGIPVYQGIAIGKVFLYDNETNVIPEYVLTKERIPEEITRFEDALIATRKDIIAIQKKVATEMGIEHANIFNAHLLVVEDRAMVEEVIKTIEKFKKNAEYAFTKVIDKYVSVFSKMEDNYLKERVSDIRDVEKRVLRHLLGEKKRDLSHFDEEVIVVAYDLSPSDTAHLDKSKVLGFVTDIGGKTSHTAIMARSLAIPAVVGLQNGSGKVKAGDIVVVDGTKGLFIVNPSNKTLKIYRERIEELTSFENKLNYLKDLSAETKDGVKIILSANIELTEEVDSVLAHGGEGIGLYRTEFFYMNRTSLPTEEEHFQSYKKVAEDIYPQSVIVRTLDLGGDKFLSHLEVPRELNPFLGWRAIRFCLERLDIFEVQLRAILRASAFGKVKIMYPMISGLEELQKANLALERVKKSLIKEKIEFDKNIEVGAMIEVPSAAIIADILAEEVDFFSIGTNDLIQYTLAVDRVNEKIDYLYEPAHPAILRLIKSVVEAAHNKGIWVGMCGEMASDPLMTTILVGLGLDEFSMSVSMLPEIKKIIRSFSLADAKKTADKALSLNDPKKVRELATQQLKRVFPELLELT